MTLSRLELGLTADLLSSDPNSAIGLKHSWFVSGGWSPHMRSLRPVGGGDSWTHRVTGQA